MSTPTTAYVRDAFVSETMRDAGQPDDDSSAAISAIVKGQERWHLWLAEQLRIAKRDAWAEGVLALANEQHREPGSGPRSVTNPYGDAS